MKNKVEQLKDMMKAKKEAEEKKDARPEPVEGPVNNAPAPGSTSSPRAGETNADEVATQLKAAEDEAKAHYDKLLRVMAEFENFKKRIERERMEQAKYSNQSLLHDLLPVIDDFDRVIEHIPQEPTSEVSAIADGVKLIQNHFITALSKHGLVPITPEAGETFDPNIHEAVAHIESEAAEGSIAIIHRKGWKLHDRVIRPATVSVSKGKQ